MKYALVTPCDQTMGYVTPDGAITTRPSEAALFDTRASAEEAADDSNGERDPTLYIEPVEDEAAFRAKSPTWEDRPYTPAALFDLAKTLMYACQNEFTREGLSDPEARQWATRLMHDADDLLSTLGHYTNENGWVFGPPPANADSPTG